MIDREKGRMRIRTKVCVALAVVISCTAIGTIVVHFMEDLSWVDIFYLSVTSDSRYAFTALAGRRFARIWLVISTLAVARATELRIDQRNRRIAKWVLQKKMTPGI